MDAFYQAYYVGLLQDVFSVGTLHCFASLLHRELYVQHLHFGLLQEISSRLEHTCSSW